MDYLIQEILQGLSFAKEKDITSCYVGIDTWAVDYCLLDKAGNRLDQPIAYRDSRTEDAVATFSEKMPLATLYEKTGIQIQSFNTIFQLFVEEKDRLAKAETLLLIPDYLGYVFTGKAVTEKTNASTMQLLHAGTQNWNQDILQLLDITEALFPPLVDAGTVLGRLRQEDFIEYDLPEAVFVSIASHDTASAVLGTPGEGADWAYISSGTWSLLGVETTVADVSKEAFIANYTNEWGVHNTIRFLKNIMGMWLIQEVARMQEYYYSYAELVDMAETVPPFQQFVDVNDERFLNPTNMIEELQSYCQETKQTVPQTAAEIARCVYDNLALCYAAELQKLETLTGTTEKICKLHIVGGGSNNRLLNQLTADIANIEIEAGPSEATAIGNIVMQMICTGVFTDAAEARHAIHRSFDCSVHQPRPMDPMILQNYQLFIKEVSK